MIKCNCTFELQKYLNWFLFVLQLLTLNPQISRSIVMSFFNLKLSTKTHFIRLFPKRNILKSICFFFSDKSVFSLSPDISRWMVMLLQGGYNSVWEIFLDLLSWDLSCYIKTWRLDIWTIIYYIGLIYHIISRLECADTDLFPAASTTSSNGVSEKRKSSHKYRYERGFFLWVNLLF